jgi:hypothetical protein
MINPYDINQMNDRMYGAATDGVVLVRRDRSRG